MHPSRSKPKGWFLSFGVLRRHPNNAGIGERAGSARGAYHFTTDSFPTRFGNMRDIDAYGALETYATRSWRGYVGETIFVFADLNDGRCEFEMSTFFNGYDLLTYGFYRGRTGSVSDTNCCTQRPMKLTFEDLEPENCSICIDCAKHPSLKRFIERRSVTGHACGVCLRNHQQTVTM